MRYRILTLNQISPLGLERFPAARYEVGPSVDAPDAVVVRSQDMHKMAIAAVDQGDRARRRGHEQHPGRRRCAKRGVPVFNAPGANANAVKELVLTALLLASRNVVPALRFVDALDRQAPDLDTLVEAGKKQFAGIELPNRTLGIIGLGAIGSLVADTAIKLGMDVIGYDPEITVDAAWRLPSAVRRANTIDELLRVADFVTLHVPLLPVTKHLIDARRLALAKPGSVLLNFARDAVVDEQRSSAPWTQARLAAYLCDFPCGRADRPSQGRRAAASRGLDGRGRGELRDHGGGPGARLPRGRDDPQRRQLPERGDGPRVAVPRGDRERQRSRTCWARSARRWRRPASTSTTW